jgi:hypothetical protein
LGLFLSEGKKVDEAFLDNNPDSSFFEFFTGPTFNSPTQFKEFSKKLSESELFCLPAVKRNAKT